MNSKGRIEAMVGRASGSGLALRGFGLDRGVSAGLAFCAVVAAGAALAPGLAAARPAGPSLQVADNRPVVMLRRNQPPEVVAYDPEAAASREAEDRDDAESYASGPADASSDALGRGVNSALAAEGAARSLGAAFDTALLDEVARLRAVKWAVEPRGAYAEALQAALAKEDEAVRALYFTESYAPIWIEENGDAAKAESLLEALALADAHALPAGRYDREGLAARVRGVTALIAEADRKREEHRRKMAEAREAHERAVREAERAEREAAARAATPEAQHAAEFGSSAPVEPVKNSPPKAPAPTMAVAMNIEVELDFVELAALERDLTKAYLAFASDMSGGAIDPKSLGEKHIDVERPAADPLALGLLARRSQNVAELAETLPPQTADYRSLLAAYEATRKIVARGGWGDKVIAKRSIRELDRGEKVDILRARLMAMGDLAVDAPRAVHPENGETLFDEITGTALRGFQSRHGLATDGVAGAKTKEALNVSAEERARQIAVNLERARWMNKPMEGRRIQVNIPDFHVDMLESGTPVYRSRVVVGKPRHQTPEFEDEMTEVIVNPYWHVPYSIATKELLPQLQENRNALRRQNIDVYHKDGRRATSWFIDWDDYDESNFPFTMKQNPGRGNALGEVKFIFPNHHSVYLHDTPAKSLFAKSRRAFSHGCIRVHKPHLLATTLLGAQSRNPAVEYASLRAQNYEQHTSLKKRVPVHIVYRTAWIEERHGLQLREDIYGRDRLLASVMERAGVAF